MKKILILLLFSSIYSCKYPYTFTKFDYNITSSKNKPEFYFIYRDSLSQKNDKVYSFNTESGQLIQLAKDIPLGQIMNMQVSKNDSVIYTSVKKYEKGRMINAINLYSKKIDTLLSTNKFIQLFKVDESRNRIYYPIYDKYLDSPTRSIGNLEFKIFYLDLKSKESKALLDTTMMSLGFSGEYKLIGDRYLFYSGMKDVKSKIQMQRDKVEYSSQIKIYLYDLENDKLIDLGRLNKFFDDRLFTNNDVSFIELIESDETDCFFVAQHNKVYKFCLKEPSKLTEVAKFAKKTRILSINPTHKKTMLCVLINYKNNEFEIREIDFKGVELNSFMVKDFKFD